MRKAAEELSSDLIIDRAVVVLKAVPPGPVNLTGVLAVTWTWGEDRFGGGVTDICVQDLPSAVGDSGDKGVLGVCCGSGARIIMPDVSVVCAGSPGAFFWTTNPNLDQTAAEGAASGRTTARPPPIVAHVGRGGLTASATSNSSSSSGGGDAPGSRRGYDMIVVVVFCVSRALRPSGSSRVGRRHVGAVREPPLRRVCVFRFDVRRYGAAVYGMSVLTANWPTSLALGPPSSRRPENPPPGPRRGCRRRRRTTAVCRSNGLLCLNLRDPGPRQILAHTRPHTHTHTY